MKLEQKSSVKKSNYQHELIRKFINPENFKDKYFWPREMKMAKKLISTYDLEFLLWVIPPYNRKIPSLAYFMADYGKQYLSEQFFNYKKNTCDLSPVIQNITLSQDKIGEDIVVKKQPKTIKDFLNLYK
jgi:hypothetical protein